MLLDGMTLNLHISDIIKQFAMVHLCPRLYSIIFLEPRPPGSATSYASSIVKI